MNIRLFLLIIILFTFNSSCSSYTSDKVFYAGKIRKQVATKLAKKFSMKPNCFGGSMIDKITMLNIGFEIYRPLTQDEARQIIVESVNELVNAVNENEHIQQYLANVPFGPENVVIDIIIYDNDGNIFYHPNLSYVVSSIGTICYKYEDSEKRFKTKVEKTETFDHAKKIVQQDNSNSH